MKLPRPARGATPDEFYLEYVPTLYEAVSAVTVLPPIDVTLTVDLEGKHHYRLDYNKGQLSVRAEPSEDALFRFFSTVRDYKTAMFDLLPRILRFAEKRALPAQIVVPDLNLLRQLPGRLDLAFTDDAGDRLSLVLEFAGGAGPEVSIEAQDADLWALMERPGSMSSFVRSRMSVAGDTSYLLKLAAVFD